MRRKGAIEISANFLVIIIISIVILAGGLSLFFSMKDKLQDEVDRLDQRTIDMIKSMMLSNNYRVAVYPQDAIVPTGDSVHVGVGITNNINAPSTRFNVNVTKIVRYNQSTSVGTPISPVFIRQYFSVSPGYVNISQGEQEVKGVLLIMPKNSTKGQYVYTINVTSLSPVREYGIVQVYVTNK
ncbi:MAG: hypothetical protein ACP5NW_03735 [Candidatus Woesearchaeota archaeon]